jgi:hypothetical protein
MKGKTTLRCHEDGENCWFADIDDQGCAGRFGTYLLEEAFRYGEAVSA